MNKRQRKAIETRLTRALTAVLSASDWLDTQTESPYADDAERLRHTVRGQLALIEAAIVTTLQNVT